MHSERNLDSGGIEEARRGEEGEEKSEGEAVVRWNRPFVLSRAAAKWNVKGRLSPGTNAGLLWMITS